MFIGSDWKQKLPGKPPKYVPQSLFAGRGGERMAYFYRSRWLQKSGGYGVAVDVSSLVAIVDRLSSLPESG